jgi:hypothetical protein
MIAEAAAAGGGIPGWVQLAVGAGLFGFLGTIITAWAMRRKDREAAAQARFAGDIELNKYIRSQIDAAQAPLLTKIGELEAQMGRVLQREADRKDILQRLFQRQTWWDNTGRLGPMPMPTEEHQRILEITITPEDTLSPDERDRLRENS